LSEPRSLVFFCIFSPSGKTGVWTEGFTLAEQMSYCVSCISSPFCSDYFGGGVLQTICPDWPQIMILLISASQVAKIMGISHQHPAKFSTFNM
jgi:hypothetical protein